MVLNAKITASLSVRAPAPQLEVYLKDSIALLKKPTSAKVVFQNVMNVLQLI